MKLADRTRAVAIDGPAGSGKSTVSRLVAERLGFVYVDTGAMYRALTLKVMREGVDLSDEARITELSSSLDVKLFPADAPGGQIRVTLDGDDVSEEIRNMDVTANVKHVCRIPAVRENLVELQRAMVGGMDGAVMEGRDIGTVVLRDAEYKFYVDAAFEERVSRRFAELEVKGQNASRDEVAEDLRHRDHTDMTREVGPLVRADDAVLVDTTGLSIKEVVDRIVAQIREN